MKDIADANVAVRCLRATNELGLRIAPIPPDGVHIVGISGSIFDTDKATGASQGSLVGMAPEDRDRNEASAFSIMRWQSHKMSCVTGSTMAADRYSLSEPLAECEWTLAFYSD